ncbi:MAG: serine hydrolase [Pseudomonadota bacterium]|nr:serine hydrolase [Pseudomonadota bacterium]
MFTHRALHLPVVLSLPVLLSGCILDDIPIGTGYAAKNICSGLWISGIEETRLTEDFVAPQISPLPLIWKIDIDESNHTVTVRDRIFGSKNEKVAYYREGLGCTLVHDKSLVELDRQAPTELLAGQVDYHSPWPQGEASIDQLHPAFDHSALEMHIDEAFRDTPDATRNTLSVAVAYKGQLVSERYTDDIEPDSPLLSWSMAKSITATVTGLLYDQGRLSPLAPAPVAEWTGTDKSVITLKNMLQMNAGLDWNEAAQGEDPDQGFGLFEVPDMPGYYAEQALDTPPGTRFNYSTGNSNLLARIAQSEVGGTLEDYYQFVQQALFQPLGIQSAVIEFDAEGQPVGGAFHYLTTRDWARLGQLYLNKGEWNGEQILSRDWIEQTLTPSEPNPLYGYQLWLNTNQGFWSDLPANTYAFRGFQGQIVMMLPDYDLVIVRTGVTFNNEGASSTSDPAGIQALALGIIASLQPE